MVLRTIDKSVGFIPKSEQTRKIKQNTIKNKSTPRKPKKKNSRNKQKFLKYISAQRFKCLKRIMNCYF